VGSVPVGVQCPLTFSLCEFPDYQDWLWYPGLSPMLVFIAFPFAFHISRCLSTHSSSPVIEFHLCFFFTTDVSAPIGRPFTYSLIRRVSRLGTGSGTQCCGPRGGAGVHMKQKSHFKFLPWPGFEPRTLQSDGHERYNHTMAHPLQYN